MGAFVQRARVLRQNAAPVHARQHPPSQTGRDHAHDFQFRAQVGRNALDGGQSPGQHGQAGRHGDAVLVHDLGHVLHHLRQIHGAQVGGGVLFQQILHIPVQPVLVRLLAELAQPQHRIPAGVHVAPGHAGNGLADQLPLPVAEGAHHAHIQPDDLAVPHPQVAGVRIGMEESVVHDLLDVIVRQLGPDLAQIVACGGQLVLLCDACAVDALHHQHGSGGIIPVQCGRIHKRHAGVELPEPFQIRGFGLEIHFLLRHHPHLVQHLVEVQQFVHGRVLEQLAGLLQQQDVTAHDLVDALPLNLHHHFFAGLQRGGVSLRNGSAAQRLLVERRKDLLKRSSVRVFDLGLYLFKGDGGHVAAKPGQGFAVGLGQNIRPHGKNLPQFDKRGTQFLDDGAELVRRDALGDLVAAHHLHDFHQALPVVAPAVIPRCHPARPRLSLRFLPPLPWPVPGRRCAPSGRPAVPHPCRPRRSSGRPPGRSREREHYP